LTEEKKTETETETEREREGEPNGASSTMAGTTTSGTSRRRAHATKGKTTTTTTRTSDNVTSNLAAASTSPLGIIFLAVVVRIALIVFGSFQDAHAEVPYTDIDYQVYSDAARFVCEGETPYARSTYRYTPLLAWLLAPNCIFLSYGKVLFAVCDILAAVMMLREREEAGVVAPAAATQRRRLVPLLIWLFSPFTATISTRGSGESLVVCMLVGMVLLLEKGRVVTGAVVYGLAVHWRIFPIVYAPAVLLFLGRKNMNKARGAERRSSRLSTFLAAYVSVKGVVFGLVSAAVFFALGAAMHGMYGREFLDETYLYHLTRVDPRHNFSFFFYPAYLRMSSVGEAGGRDWLSTVFSLAGLAVQAVIADRMMRGQGGMVDDDDRDDDGDEDDNNLNDHDRQPDLAMTFLAQSIAFVAFNKVSTAQYFVWYLCWFCLRLEWATAHVDRRWVVAWPVALANWLFWAYLLEFRGLPVHLFIWIAGIFWFSVHAAVLHGLVQL